MIVAFIRIDGDLDGVPTLAVQSVLAPNVGSAERYAKRIGSVLLYTRLATDAELGIIGRV
jgi:hypothetical protein